MGRKRMDAAEKAPILTWQQENVTIKDICKHTGKAKSSIMALLATDCGFPPKTD